jgi:hypothetical protein
MMGLLYGSTAAQPKDISQMRSSHAAGAVSASFSDPNLIASAGLVPLVRLAERHGLPDLISQHVRLSVTTGANPAGKAMTIVAGMCAGADSIDDLDMLRTGGMDKAFDTIYAPSTLGSFLRSFTHGHVRQLQAATGRFTAALVGELGLLADSDVVHLDIDSKVKQVYGPAKQGASFGYTKVRGLHFLVVTASTPHSRPVIVATRLRAGRAGSGRGAASLAAEAIRTLRTAGITATILVRADSAFFSAKLVKACRDAPGVHFSITVANTEQTRASIEKIPQAAWMPIKYRNAVWDDGEQRWVSEAEIAEIPHDAFTSKKTKYHVTARLIVRRVKRLNPTTVPEGQGELFAVWRHHGFLTDDTLVIEQAEPRHRQHAIIEQVFSDLENGPLRHLPSGKFQANAAWLTLAAAAFNLMRAAGRLAGPFHAKATGATLRRTLINTPGRIASSARRIHLHLPDGWPWAGPFHRLLAHTGHRMAC